MLGAQAPKRAPALAEARFASAVSDYFALSGELMKNSTAFFRKRTL